MKRSGTTIVATAALFMVTFGLSVAAGAQAQTVPIDYGGLLAGKGAPAGTTAKLKRAAQLAAAGGHCARVDSGAYIPPRDQRPDQKGKPYMITCEASDSGGYYNVYFSAADLATSQRKDRATPISRNVAFETCAKALQHKFPQASLHVLLENDYFASKSTSNVVERIGLTIKNKNGVTVHKVGKCTIGPDGTLRSEDVRLVQ